MICGNTEWRKINACVVRLTIVQAIRGIARTSRYAMLLCGGQHSSASVLDVTVKQLKANCQRRPADRSCSRADVGVDRTEIAFQLSLKFGATQDEQEKAVDDGAEIPIDVLRCRSPRAKIFCLQIATEVIERTVRVGKMFSGRPRIL